MVNYCRMWVVMALGGIVLNCFIHIHGVGCFGLGRLVISANFQSHFGVLAKALSRSPVADP